MNAHPADHLGGQRRGKLFVPIHDGLLTAVIFRHDTTARLASWLTTTIGVPIRTSRWVARPRNGARAAMNNIICAMPMWRVQRGSPETSCRYGTNGRRAARRR